MVSTIADGFQRPGRITNYECSNDMASEKTVYFSDQI
jgi:hypothetical protein